jgi:prolyl-tRNA synthetase
MLNVYADICQNYLAIPVIKGQKTDKEKFAGAVATYTVESLMHDGKALQSGTSHNFGNGFAKAFNIEFTGKDNKPEFAHQTSWGVSTRLIGAIIMVHGDNEGLVLPPNIAPIQAALIPIARHKPGVLEKCAEIKRLLADFSVILDDSDKSPGWKFAEYEMKGVPVRIELGPKDIENNQAVLVRRDTREKKVVSLDEIQNEVKVMLDAIQSALYEKALKHREETTNIAKNFDELKEIAENKPGFIKAMWCGGVECELKIKEETAVTSRCIPFEQEKIADTCVCCGKPASKMLYWGKAY